MDRPLVLEHLKDLKGLRENSNGFYINQESGRVYYRSGYAHFVDVSGLYDWKNILETRVMDYTTRTGVVF